MNIPSVPIDTVTDENGGITPVWGNFFAQLVTQLQTNLNQEGYTLPRQTTANVAALNTDQSKGNLIYDSETEVIQMNNRGTYREVYPRPQELTSAQIAAIPADQISGTWVYDTDTTQLKYGILGVFREVFYV